MANTPPPAGGGNASAPPRRRIATLLALALLPPLALAVGLVVAVGPAGLRAMLSDPPASTDVAAATQEAAAPPGADLAVMPFDEMIVNITATTASGRQTTRFLKLDLALVYDRAQAGAEQVETRHIYLRDAFQDYLRQLTDRDLDGTLGLVTLKGELLRRARAVAGSDAPHELLVSGLVVQ